MTWLHWLQIASIIICGTMVVWSRWSSNRRVRRAQKHYAGLVRDYGRMREQAAERDDAYRRMYLEYNELRALYRERLGLPADEPTDEERLH